MISCSDSRHRSLEKRVAMIFPKPLCVVIVSLVSLSTSVGSVQAQNDQEEPPGVVIERAALNLISPERFKVPLHLKPVTMLPVVAPMDGTVQDVFVKLGDSVRPQVELLRLDSQELSLSLKRTQAELEVAKLVVSQASDPKEKALSEAKLEVVKRELALAEFRLGQTIQRSAIDGVVTELLVRKGQFVRAGDLLARVTDPTQLYVDVPVERDLIDIKQPFPLTIETSTVEAKVEGIHPPLPEFDPLRELFVSVATARVLVDSNSGKFTVGQGVSSDMIPRFPIAEIQILAVKTASDNPDAERSVQVIRNGFVRDLPVQALGQVGETHVFVSARFVEGDELVVSSSEELRDGSWVRPVLVESEADKPGRSRVPGRMNTPRTGF